jgi:GrpB-like predicted nucleotidyltransferase (UPF0157 family)
VIEVVDYDPRWPEQFAELARRYEAALRGVPVLAIEHVGSTAVPGLAAKPVIDVDIVVAEEHVAATAAALEAIGYEPRGEQGVPQRWAFQAPEGTITTNTYVTLAGCLSLRNHLGVRDVLRADPDLRAEYGALKARLAASLDDIDAYVEAKSVVLQQVLARAGLGPDEQRLIDDLNRR